jgi:hypothetical protein
MGINQRVSLRKFTKDISRWVEEGRSDDWIASALGTTPSSVQSFRSRNAIYRKESGWALSESLANPREYSSYEGVVESGKPPGVWLDPAVADDPLWNARWRDSDRVELYLTPTSMVLVRPGRGRRDPERTRRTV